MDYQGGTGADNCCAIGSISLLAVLEKDRIDYQIDDNSEYELSQICVLLLYL